MAPTVRHPQKLLARIVFSVVHFHVVSPQFLLLRLEMLRLQDSGLVQ